MLNNSAPLPLAHDLRIMYDQTQFSPVWFQDRAGLWINEASYFAMRDISGYAPEGWITYTQNTPASCFFGAFPHDSLEEEARVGFTTFGDPAFVDQFEAAITTAYDKTKLLHDRYFSTIAHHENLLLKEDPALLTTFIRDVRSLTTYIMSYYLQTQPQRFWQFERALALHLPSSDLELVSSTGRRLTYLTTIDSRLTECAHHFDEACRAPETLFSDTSIVENTLKETIERYGFLFWGLIGGEYIDHAHAQLRITSLLKNKKFLSSERAKFSKLEARLRDRTRIMAREAADLYQYADIMGHVSVMRFDLQTFMLCVLKYVDTIITAVKDIHAIDDTTMKSYTTDEILTLIEQGNKVPDKVLSERQEGFLTIYSHSGTSHYQGAEATTTIKPLLDTRDSEIKNAVVVQGTIASWPPIELDIIEGRAFVLTSAFDNGEVLAAFREGDILIATQTHPHLVPYMKTAGAIVTDEGGITCHAAIVARELNKCCLIGTRLGSKVFTTGEMVVLNRTTKTLSRKL